ncbi:MAG TPA: polysaccharide biosynthesis tyrosine autokinase [Chromatiales bacterium]|nr:polysaccharide biosynthesis tyrosine autokinase [Chromatiales bacterium]
MEKVKEALAKARAEREAIKEADVTPKPAWRKRSNKKAPAELKIVYTETQVIDVKPEHWDRMRVIADDSLDTRHAEAYKVLRTRVLQRLRANNWNAIAITSPTEGDGKTLTSVNLAISLAREVNQTVLLVDLDLRRPNVHNYFVPRPVPGISDYIVDDTELSDILFNPGIERLVVLPGNHSFTHSSEMLSSPKMVSLINELKTRYPSRIVLFDLPPVLSCDDVLAFSPYVDASLLVVEENKTTKQELKRAVDLLQETNFLGWVLNKSNEKGAGYGYYGYY